MHRRLVREALMSAWPAPRKELPARPSLLDPFKDAIDGMLREDLGAPRKQGHAAKRINDRLLAEYGAHVVSYFMVKTYVAARRPQIWAQAGRGAPEVFIEQSHLPGQEAEVDFGEVMVELAGVACPSARSAMTTCAPRWPRCWAFPGQGGDRPMGGLPLALPAGGLPLPAGQAGRKREGRRGGRGRLLPPQPSGARPAGEFRPCSPTTA
ncbi:hypothetical protein GCM10023334_095010 [Nonomuraea thailandensis]